MKKIILIFSFSLFISGQVAAQCSPPENPLLIIDGFSGDVALIWDFPGSSDCPILFYEVHFASQPIGNPGSPPPGEVISNLTFNQISLPFGTNYAWIRSVCDCEPFGDPDGIGDSESTWIEATVCYNNPIFPDEGTYCPGPEAAIAQSSQCLNIISAEMYFIAIFEFEGEVTVDCTGETEYIIWRTFTAPITGELDVSISSFEWSDFGFMIRESCSSSNFYCRPQIGDNEVDLITGLSPGDEYLIGVWNNDYPYYSEPIFDICGGIDYNGTANYLKLCVPEESCPSPFTITTNSITDQSAQIQWNGNGSIEWSIEYGESGFILGQGTILTNITQSSYQLVGLDPEVEYDFYLTANCGAAGQSPAIGPYTFMTEPSIWITSEVGTGSVYCCDEYAIPESFGAESFCGELSFNFSDEQVGSGCDYTLFRTITASDACGNSVTSVYELTVQDNDLPCGCEASSTFNENYNSDLVAIDGDWAAFKSGGDHQILHKENGVWVEHSQFQLQGSPFFWSLHIEDSLLLANNEVFRLNEDEWSYETSLVPSSASGNITKVAIDNGQVFILNNGYLTIFEDISGVWEVIASIPQAGQSLDVDDDVLGIGIFSQDTIGSVYRKVEGQWTFEQDIVGIPDGLGNGQGADCAISGDNLAIGTSYFGGIHTYHYSDGLWSPVAFIENPYLASESGYYSNFGAHMDMEGDLLLVGDEMNQVNGNFSGSVVLLEWTCGGWLPQRNIVPVNGGPGQRFGGSVAMDEEGQFIVGIDATQWIGSGGYGFAGQIHIMTCLDVENAGCPITGSAGAVLECGESLPEPEFEIGENWDEDYTVSIDITGELNACGDSLIRTILVEDVNGNIGTVVQTYVYADTTPPFLSIGADVSIECDENIPAPDFIAEDNCGAVTVTVNELFTPSCGEAGVMTRVYTAEDECGNGSEETQQVTLVDTTPPSLECPENWTVEVDENGGYTLPSLLGGIVIEESCSLPLNLVQLPASGTVLGQGIQLISITGTDLCGNLGQCEATLTVIGPNNLIDNVLDNLLIYPNPSDDILFISESQTLIGSPFELRDALGRIVLSGQIKAGATELAVLDLKPGIYDLMMRHSESGMNKVFKVSIIH